MDKTSIGRKGEELASDFFRKKGFSIIARNYRSRFGEIDLILKKDKTFRFVEVKYRRTEEYGLPQESVRKRKQAKIKKTALLWLKIKQLPMDSDLHFDVLAIIKQTSRISYEYIEDAF